MGFTEGLRAVSNRRRLLAGGAEVRRLAAGWVEPLISLVYPAVCEICGKVRAGPKEGFVCGECRARPGQLRQIEPPWCRRCGLPFPGDISGPFACSNCRDQDWAFDGARAAVVATPFLLDVIHRYKYRGSVWFEAFLGGLLVDRAAPALAATGPWEGLVPVPLHAGRRRDREFNQADRLAWCLSKATGIPVVNDLVVRSGATRTQALLTRGERLKNVAEAFRLRHASDRAGRRMIVIDDVLTTGATTSAVSAVLRAAGAREVRVWTVARGV